MVLSNGIGALVVVVLAVFVLPTPDLDDRDTVIRVNLVVAAIYLVAAIIVGAVWGLSRLGQTHRWLMDDREPSEEEQKTALRLPLRQMRLVAGVWLPGAVGFAVVHLTWAEVLAETERVAVVLPGVTASAVSYLLIQGRQPPGAVRR